MILGFLKQLLGSLLGNDASAAPAPQTNTSRRARAYGSSDTKSRYDESDDEPASFDDSSADPFAPGSGLPMPKSSELTAEETRILQRYLDEHLSDVPADILQQRENMAPEDIFEIARVAWNNDEFATSTPLSCELALQNYGPAFSDVGLALEFGQGGMQRNEELMLKCYLRGLESKNYTSLYRLGIYFMDHQRYDEARALFEQSIEEGWNSDEELYQLGRIYEEALGVPYDKDKAIHYYRMAHRLKSIDASWALDRLGATYDAEEFDFQLPNSERFKTADELYNIGNSENQGFRTNIPLAVAYFNAAAAKGDARAAYELALIYDDSSLPIYDKAKSATFAQQAYAGLLQAAEQYPGFADIAGKAFWQGTVGPKNMTKARQALQIGIDRSEIPENSMWIMAQILHEEGKHEEAFRYAYSAAERGQGMAMFDVAKSYENGIGTTANFNEAIRWYKACIGTPYVASSDAQDHLAELGISV